MFAVKKNLKSLIKHTKLNTKLSIHVMSTYSFTCLNNSEAKQPTNYLWLIKIKWWLIKSIFSS